MLGYYRLKQLYDFRLDGQVQKHPIFQKISLNKLAELNSFIKNESFKSQYFSDKYVLSLSSEEGSSGMCNISFHKLKVTQTIEHISDSILILKDGNFRLILISADKLDDRDFVIENSIRMQTDTTVKRIRGVFAANSTKND